MRLIVITVLIGAFVHVVVGQGLIGGFARKVSNLISYSNENRGQDGYEFQYATDDGTVREEKGSFINGIWTVIGRSLWRDEQGNEHQTVYKADDKGTQVMEGRISKGALASLPG